NYYHSPSLDFHKQLDNRIKLLLQTLPTRRSSDLNSGANITALTVTLPQVPRAGDVLVVANVSNNLQVSVSGGGVSSWNYIWSQELGRTRVLNPVILKRPLPSFPSP